VINVCLLGQTGRHLLALSFTVLDPEQTFIKAVSVLPLTGCKRTLIENDAVSLQAHKHDVARMASLAGS
jgi:hypothetical protein